MKRVQLLVIALLSLSSNAQWNSAARDLEKIYDHPFRDEVMTTVWGNIVKTRFAERSKEKIKTESRTIYADLRLAQDMPYHYSYSKKWKSDEAKPVFVFIPGIFSPIDGYQAKDMVRRFVNLGYRVVSFSNPLGKQYLEADPKHELLDLEIQAKIYQKAIYNILDILKIRKQWNGHAIIGGVSYGALASSIIFTIDQRLSRKARNQSYLNQLVIFGPPMNLIRSAQRLDMYIEQTKTYKYFDSLPRAIQSYFHLRNMKDRNDATYETHMMAREALTQESFVKGLAGAVSTYSRVNGLNVVPKKDYKAWKKKLRFIPTFQDMSSKAYKKMSTTKMAILSRWILESKSLIQGKPNKKIMILAAADDVINDGVDPKLRGLPETMELPFGGHYGFQCLEWFDRLITAQFKLD
ncbi:MAG: hypothetical protein GY909_03575 [Oligoflexia bacterium]|nr:hypothetical protein [Oligoflexia bacterium]